VIEVITKLYKDKAVFNVTLIFCLSIKTLLIQKTTAENYS